MIDQVVFRIHGREYRWRDVLVAAERWGEWDALAGRVAAAIARLEAAESQSRAPAPDELEAAAEEFRYAHDLLTAEELEDWLQRWTLTLEDWENYLRRTLAEASPTGNAARPGAPAPSLADPVLWGEAVCSGVLAEWAERLAARAAIAVRWREEIAPVSPAAGDRGQDPASGPEAMSFDELLAELETAYAWVSAQLPASRALEDHLSMKRSDWTRLNCALLAFDEEGRAREAAMLAREDRLPVQDVAAASSTAVEEASFLLEDLEPALREQLVSVVSHQWAGPLPFQGRFLLLYIRDRIPPLLDDPGIRDRATRSLLVRLAEREVSRHVTWCQRL